MVERFVYSTGTISVSNGSATVTGTGTAWSGRDRAGSRIVAYPVSGVPITVGTVAEVVPVGIYSNTSLPLVHTFQGTTLTNVNYEIIDGPAIANGATQASIFARFAAFLQQSMGLAANSADSVDMALVPENSLFVDSAAGILKQWRGGLFNTVSYLFGKQREVLTANRNYFVRIDGSDSNNGLADSAGGAFRTITFAISAALQRIDCAGFGVTIVVRDGTYPENVTVDRPAVGSPGGRLFILGNVTTPGNVLINPSGGFAAVSVSDKALLNLSGVKVTGNIDIYVGIDGALEFSDVDFGASSDTFWAQLTIEGGRVNVSGNYRISGGGACHVRCFGTRSSLRMFSRAVTITGTPNFTQSFIELHRLAEARTQGSSFSGAVTGRRYVVDINSIVDTGGGGINFFPGSIAGFVGPSAAFYF